MDKRLKEILQRKQEIRAALTGGGEINLEELKTELAGLEAEVSVIEERKKIAAQLNVDAIEGNEVELPGTRNTQVEPEKMERDALLAAPEYRSAYMRRLMEKPLTEVEQRMISSAVGSGGAVIPTQTLNKIVEKLKQVGVIFPLVSVMEIPSNLSIPFEKVTADVSWVDEVTAATADDDSVDELSLAGHKLLKLIEISAQLENMSIDAFENFIVTQLANKVKMAVDAGIISGNGVKKSTGILNEATPITTAATTGWTYKDITTLIAAVKSGYRQGAVFVMSSNTLYNQVAQIMDKNDKPIFIPNVVDGFEGKLLGRPVVAYDSMADDTIIFGNFAYYFFNWVLPFIIEKSKEAGFTSGSTVYRALGLADGKPVFIDEAFAVQELKTTI